MNDHEKYGINIKNFIEEKVDLEMNDYIGLSTRDVNVQLIEKNIEHQLRSMGIFEVLKPSINIDIDPYNPHMMNVSVNFCNDVAFPDILSGDLVTISPTNDKTHTWELTERSYECSIYYCKKCSLKKVASSFNLNATSPLILATENLNCSEVSVKDVIE